MRNSHPTRTTLALLCCIGCLGLLAGRGHGAIVGRVVDADGQPVAGVAVSVGWSLSKDRYSPYKLTHTAEDGTFTHPSRRSPAIVAAFDDERRTGGFALVGSSGRSEITLVMQPLVSIKGRVKSDTPSVVPKWTNIYVHPDGGRARIGNSTSKDGTFEFRLPRGNYLLYVYGEDLESRQVEIDVDQNQIDLGVVTVPATVMSRHYGKPPPPWQITDRRRLQTSPTIETFRGKWLLIEFWGYW